MSKMTHTENNPFFIHDMDKICLVCNHKLIKHPIYSIFDELTKIEPKTNVMNALELVSNFKQLNIYWGPQRICSTCYNNTIAAVRFWRMCEKSIAHLEFYLQHQNDTEQKFDTTLNDHGISKNIRQTPIQSSHNTDEVMIKTELLKIELDSIDKSGIEKKKAALNKIDNSLIYSDEDKELDINKQSNKGNFKNEKSSDPGAIRIPCKVCLKLYRQDYMPKHIRVHTGERPYSCKNCDSRFKGPTELKTHITSVHSESREFLCNTCGKSFKLQAHLHGHLKIHTDERPYECKICGKRFRTTNTLKEHSKVHSDQRPIACEICGKCFPGKKHLRQHMISHAEVKKHECHLCGNRFTQAHSLRTHLSRHCKGNVV